MTPFTALQALCGLSNREAAAYLDIGEKHVEKLRSGARTPAPAMLAELQKLWTLIEQAAVDGAEAMTAEGILENDVKIEIGYPVDDHEAESLGFPCIGAWRQMAARLMDELVMMDDGFDLGRISFVPRGSTPSTAAAMDAHGQ